MSKLPRNIKPQKLIKFLVRLGFKEGKGKGSHVRLTHPDGRWTQVALQTVEKGARQVLDKWTKSQVTPAK